MDAEKLNAPTPPVGVIESLAAGFEMVAGSLALILLPLLVDLFIWMGPRISYRPAIEAYYNEIWQPALASFEPDVQASFASVSALISSAAENLPTTYLPLIGFPSLMSGREAQPLPLDILTPPTWEIVNPLGLVGVNLLSLLASLLLGAFYITFIAARVRGGLDQLEPVLSRLPANLMRMLVFGIALPLILLAIYLPFMVIGMGLTMLGSVMAFVGLLIDWGGRLLVLWIALFLVFTVHGMFINDRGLAGALWDSIRVVQWNMTATLFLVLLIVVLNLALTAVWNMAPAGTWLAVVALAGNAFINTGLLTATFVFFKDRYRYWREVQAELLAELERRRAQQQSKG